jgi:hypothetical protein
VNGTHQCGSLICCRAFSPNLCGRGFDLQENGSGMSSKPAGQFVDSHLQAQRLKPFFVFVWCSGRLQLLSISSRPFGHDQIVSVLISVTADMSPTGDLHVTAIFSLGRGRLELAQAVLLVALAWHSTRSSTPNGPRVNHSSKTVRQGKMRCQSIWRWFLNLFRVGVLA